MTIEYSAGTPSIRERGRFVIYEGDNRSNRHVVAKCKPTSVEAEHSLALIMQINRLDDQHRIDIVGVPDQFYCRYASDAEQFALEAAELIFGEQRNMLIDIAVNPVRLTSPVYDLAESFGVIDRPIEPKPKTRGRKPKASTAKSNDKGDTSADEPRDVERLTEGDLEGATELPMPGGDQDETASAG